MFKTLIAHGFKQATRSPIWAKNVATNIMLGFLALMMLSYVILFGLFLNEIADMVIEDFFKEDTRISLINRFLLYYFGLEFMMRFFLQKTPVLFIQPYLHLPVKKTRIVHFMLAKSFVSIFNLLAILLLLPFGFITVLSQVGIGGFAGWIGAVIGLAVVNHFLGIYIKKKLNDYPNLIVGIAGLIIVLWALEYFGILAFTDVSAAFFGGFMENPILALALFALAALLYWLNFRYLASNTYPEELVTEKASKAKGSADFGFLRRFGKTGQLIALELRLILRHKRPRNTLVLSSILLLYGLIFYTDQDLNDMPGFFILAGILITGAFFINHGQFLLSWQSGHFDAILTKGISLEEYLTSKYWLLVASCTIAYIVSIAYVFFGWDIVAINFATFLFNVGINVPIVMRLAMFSPKKIDLTRGAAFNWEGVGAAQWLMGFPVMLLPYVIYVPLSLAGYSTYGFIAMGAAGAIGLLFHRQVLKSLTKAFTNKRHRIAGGFRAQ